MVNRRTVLALGVLALLVVGVIILTTLVKPGYGSSRVRHAENAESTLPASTPRINAPNDAVAACTASNTNQPPVREDANVVNGPDSADDGSQTPPRVRNVTIHVVDPHGNRLPGQLVQTMSRKPGWAWSNAGVAQTDAEGAASFRADRSLDWMVDLVFSDFETDEPLELSDNVDEYTLIARPLAKTLRVTLTCEGDCDESFRVQAWRSSRYAGGYPKELQPIDNARVGDVLDFPFGSREFMTIRVYTSSAWMTAERDYIFFPDAGPVTERSIEVVAGAHVTLRVPDLPPHVRVRAFCHLGCPDDHAQNRRIRVSGARDIELSGLRAGSYVAVVFTIAPFERAGVSRFDVGAGESIVSVVQLLDCNTAETITLETEASTGINGILCPYRPSVRELATMQNIAAIERAEYVYSDCVDQDRGVAFPIRDGRVTLPRIVLELFDLTTWCRTGYLTGFERAGQTARVFPTELVCELDVDRRAVPRTAEDVFQASLKEPQGYVQLSIDEECTIYLPPGEYQFSVRVPGLPNDEVLAFTNATLRAGEDQRVVLTPTDR